MNVVGIVGNLISPFHPFGGAVDVIVVEQEDGTYRSTPWYVQFGKFQGVLKGAEKIVGISVNGVEANFHMFLDNSGEAYFVKEVVSGSEESESNDQVFNNSNPLESIEGDIVDSNDDGRDHQNSNDECKGETENSEQSFGFRDERSSLESPAGSPGYRTYHYGSLDEVENLVKSSEESTLEMVLVSVDGHVLTAPISSNEESTDNVQLSTPQFHLGPNGDVWGTGLFGDLDSSIPKNVGTSGFRFEDPKDAREVSLHHQETLNSGARPDMGSSSENFGAGMSRDDMFKSCLDLMSHNEDNYSRDVGPPSMGLDAKDGSAHSPGNSSSDKTVEESEVLAGPNHKNGEDMTLPNSSFPCGIKSQAVSVVGIRTSGNTTFVNFEQKDKQLGASLLNSDLSCYDAVNIETEVSEKKNSDIENTTDIGSDGLFVQSISNDLEQKEEQMESSPGKSAIEEECSKLEVPEFRRSVSGLGFEISLCGNLLRPGMGLTSAEEAFEAHRISEEEFKASGTSIIKNGNLIVRFKDSYLPWDKAAHIILGIAVFGSNFSIEPKDSIPVEHVEVNKVGKDTHAISPSLSSRRWRLWPIPFRRVKTLQHSNSNSSNEEVFVDSESCMQSPRAEPSPNGTDNQSPRKQFVRTNIPTTEQIASLNLKDGQNLIAFSFSTRVLGKQQVDAHIYLWKWNARIVISDVDGTITKSDVLGQFMPLVGKDWSQSGVARLFSAIKENGYQLLFLSARAIVQAYLTRSFLLNLKQDGKTLPSGPVVISPDGLFPSLYREVIRRAPHEFKIACLEDIKALFPSDCNPFYAGFGNRDTDELSYKRIGIPKGKIFIINPKGEVAINHCVDVKSYTSLHTLVNDMFPPTSVAEQEDFNSWNYWKMPLPSIDC